MQVWVNLYTLKNSPSIPYALAFKSKKAAKKQRIVTNQDLVYQRRIKVEVEPRVRNPLCDLCGTDHTDSRDRDRCEDMWRRGDHAVAG